MVWYLCALIVFSLHRESLKLILAMNPSPRWFYHGSSRIAQVDPGDEPLPEVVLSQSGLTLTGPIYSSVDHITDEYTSIFVGDVAPPMNLWGAGLPL
jgi:hypothetical protein